VIFYAAFLYVFSPMNLLVIGWFADFEDAISHRVHEVSIGALFTLGFIGVLAHLRKTDRSTGEVLAVIALSIAAAVIIGTTGFEPLVLAYIVPPFALIALDHDWRTTVRPPLRVEVRLLTFAALLVAIVGPDVVANVVKASHLVQGHESHWGAIAAFDVALVLAALVAGLRPPGWRLAAWSTAGAVAVLAVVSMAFRYDASALGVSHSIVALLWATGYVFTVVIVGSRDPERLPVRRRAEGLVSGVAAAVAARTGWRVGWIRAAFVVPILGGATYGVLWIALPVAEGDGRPRVLRLVLGVFLLFAVSSLLVGGTGAGFLLALGTLLTTATLGFKPLLGLLRRRVAASAVVARAAAGVGLGVALLGVAVVWLLDDVSPPVVPHHIEAQSFQYCASCHAVFGVARGAPVLPDIIEHSGGELCVSCHSHLPVSTPSPSAASWRLPLTQAAP